VVPTLGGYGLELLFSKCRVGPAPLDPQVRSHGGESVSRGSARFRSGIDRTCEGSVLELSALVL
jgi:hypothetical protein